LLADKQSSEWVWAAVPTPARRRLRRIWADESRAKVKEEEDGWDESTPALTSEEGEISDNPVNVTYNIQNIEIHDSVVMDSKFTNQEEE
jgi:hypothetical protein